MASPCFIVFEGSSAFGKAMCTGATTGLPTSSCTCSALESGIAAGLAVQSLPL